MKHPLSRFAPSPVCTAPVCTAPVCTAPVCTAPSPAAREEGIRATGDSSGAGRRGRRVPGLGREDFIRNATDC
ncbi:MAG: hypothetical protein LBI66_08295 [Burkholderiaceae bacterium]|jgi:hypothetical protein|nr:hypothetical protein [Burkholderiaceae bacterium]